MKGPLKITVVDYGVGNLASVKRALEMAGGEVQLSSKASEIVSAERLLLPGVGAFGDGMKGLHSLGLVDALKEYAQKQRPFLGICLGMQMLLDRSTEFGEHAGLGLIEGEVRHLPRVDTQGQPLKVPHIGWNALHLPEGQNFSIWKKSLLATREDHKAFAYFVHSYASYPSKSENLLADTRYGGHSVPAVIGKAHVMGCQFHPEKSGPEGLKMLEDFLHL